MENLAVLEALCEGLYSSHDSAERANAENMFKQFFQDPNFISQLEYVLENAKNPYAVYFASSSLLKHVTDNNPPSQLQLQIRNRVINYLATRSADLENFVTTSLIQLVCRLTKIGWFGDGKFQEFISDSVKFLNEPESSCYAIGLKMLNQLVSEMNQQTPGFSVIQHRKVSTKFIDQALLEIYSISVTSLIGVINNAQQKLQELALSLSLQCLSFDFMETSDNGSSDDVSAIQALECLGRLTLVRRSLFTSYGTRGEFLTALMMGTKYIMQTEYGLHNQDSESINMYSKVDINEERKKILIELQEELLEEPKLYCSLFGGDYEFEKDTIVQLWMAGGFLNNVQIEEGFLKRSDMDGELMKQMQMEDAGNLCFEILEKHEYLLPSRLDISSGKMMYKSNPDKTEASFVETQSHDLYSQLIKEQSSDCAPPIKSRHVSVLVDRINETTFTTLKKIDGLRTLLFLRNYGSSLKQIPSGVFLALKSLQALDLSGSEITQLPSSIQYLTLLRYLDLSYTPIERLPDSIGCLHELQTLKLKGCKHLCELPKGMGKLTNLRHLYFDVLGQLSYMPRSLGALTELRTLSAFLVDDRDGCNINELKGLNNLSGFFCLSGLENVPSDSVDDGLLRDKKGLTQLHLRWDRLRDKNYGDHTQVIQKLQPHSCLQELEMYCYPGSQLPIWMGKKYELEKLVRIVLFECENNELDISLGALPNLEYLEIVQMNNVSKIDNNVLRGDDNVAFPKLETLIIDGMSSLEGWERTKSCDFPALSTLVIKQCPKLATLPFLPYLHCLKHAEISRCEIFESVPHTTKETLIINRCSILEKSCSKGSTDWESIRKVPNIWINHEDPRTLNEDDTQNDSEGTGSNSDYSDDSDLGEDQVDRKDNGQTSDAELQRDTSVE
ncbi:putative disease resistance RPP13-like protein 1 isoform X2 [Beta vulgaris subsp. vulgaris]|uniref:putative disease resistance RPP13-like protein 1 isoform X2 n=1 Tax=Beta vulgaris subsp. vulgaris TaxID=3555 RepID=UPI00203696B5|nr:putative disease resistance RPP13-like protein 1 isoform X2 [Beta vulgaris subsp. vulgaris]